MNWIKALVCEDPKLEMDPGGSHLMHYGKVFYRQGLHLIVTSIAGRMLTILGRFVL